MAIGVPKQHRTTEQQSWEVTGISPKDDKRSCYLFLNAVQDEHGREIGFFFETPGDLKGLHMFLWFRGHRHSVVSQHFLAG